MKLTRLDEATGSDRTLAVGEFDGVHLGHREVISGSDCVLTFDPHPRAVVGTAGPPALLTNLRQKARLIAGLGVGELIVATFNEEFSRMTAAEFIDDVLVDRLGAQHISVGANFRFGNRAAGDPDTLRADHRFSTRVVDLVATADGEVSSSRIRELLAAGDLQLAERLLGHRFQLEGEVVHGAGRGRELGYPTANVAVGPEMLMPSSGIYACFVDSKPAVASLGRRPTFEQDGDLLLEVHLIDWSGDLYGELIAVDFLERIRGEARFEGPAELIAQMDDDRSAAAAICLAAAAR